MAFLIRAGYNNGSAPQIGCREMTRLIAIASVAIVANTAHGIAQTRSFHDTATAYGSRLNAKGQPANVNQARINNRIDNRINSRLSLRIERYLPQNIANPTVAFRTGRDDKARSAPVIAVPLLQRDTP